MRQIKQSALEILTEQLEHELAAEHIRHSTGGRHVTGLPDDPPERYVHFSDGVGFWNQHTLCGIAASSESGGWFWQGGVPPAQASRSLLWMQGVKVEPEPSESERDAWNRFREEVRRQEAACCAPLLGNPYDLLADHAWRRLVAEIYGATIVEFSSGIVGPRRVSRLLTDRAITAHWPWTEFAPIIPRSSYANRAPSESAARSAEIRTSIRYTQALLEAWSREGDNPHSGRWPEGIDLGLVLQWLDRQRGDAVKFILQRIREATLDARLSTEVVALAYLYLADTRDAGPRARVAPDYLQVPGHQIYVQAREYVASGELTRVSDSEWPTALISQGDVVGRIQLRPPEADVLLPDDQSRWVAMMWRQQSELSDLGADALDCLSALWIEQAQYQHDDAWADVDEMLRMRGVAPKKGGTGRRGGYEAEQRREMLVACSHVFNLWFDVSSVTTYDGPADSQGQPTALRKAVQSRAFTLTERYGQYRIDGYLEVEKFGFRPGRILSYFLWGEVGRQTALLSRQALKFNPRTQRPEKRLTRYFSWQWRARTEDVDGFVLPFLVEDMVRVAGLDIDAQKPSRTLERLESALDMLKMHGVIRHWQYAENNTVDQLPRRDWVGLWLKWRVEIEPPDEIRDHYVAERRLRALPPAEPIAVPVTLLDSPAPLADRMRMHRKALGLAQAQVAEILGIHQVHYSRLELGRRNPTSDLRAKIEAWLMTT